MVGGFQVFVSIQTQVNGMVDLTCNHLQNCNQQDVLEFRAKYRPMTFELKIFSHDHTPDTSYTNPELLVAQETPVSDVVDLLCSSW